MYQLTKKMYQPTTQPTARPTPTNQLVNHRKLLSPEELEHKELVTEHPVDRLQRKHGRPRHTPPGPVPPIGGRKIDAPIPSTTVGCTWRDTASQGRRLFFSEEKHRYFVFVAVVVPQKCQYVLVILITANTGTIAATGITPHTPTASFPSCAKKLDTHYSGQPALVNRH